MSQHTPGPWRACNDDSNIPEYDREECSRNWAIHSDGDVGRGGSWVAVVEGDVFDPEEQEANALLIAAAPALYRPKLAHWWRHGNIPLLPAEIADELDAYCMACDLAAGKEGA